MQTYMELFSSYETNKEIMIGKLPSGNFPCSLDGHDSSVDEGQKALYGGLGSRYT
jgi:hypothetical protein